VGCRWQFSLAWTSTHSPPVYEHSEQARPPPHTNTGHLNPGPRQCHSDCWRRRHAQKRRSEYRVLVVNGHIRIPRYRLRSLPAAPHVVRRRYLIMAAGPFPAAPFVVWRRYLIVVLRPLFAAPLVVRRRYLSVVPRPLPATLRRCCSSRRTIRQMRSGAE
jgi:hypothetical protein